MFSVATFALLVPYSIISICFSSSKKFFANSRKTLPLFELSLIFTVSVVIKIAFELQIYKIRAIFILLLQLPNLE
jgi:hypothetical protein